MEQALLARLTGWLTRLVDVVDRWVSERTDGPLVDRGYTITKIDGGRPWTRTHRYRSSVWDRRHACERCQGSGHRGARHCERCAGTGVITDSAVVEVGETP